MRGIELNAEQFTALCESKGACRDGLEWIRGKSFEEFWNTAERADWMLWIAGKMVRVDGWWTRQQIVLTACACAETVLDIFEKKYPNDKRPRVAIETARRWCSGVASIEEVRDASASAYAAAADAAAYAAAYAAYAAADAWRSARNSKMKELCAIVRQNLPLREDT